MTAAIKTDNETSQSEVEKLEKLLLSRENEIKFLKEYIANRPHLFVQSDGGCRGDGISATWWMIRVSHSGSRKCTTVASGESIVRGNLSSFHIEALAMHKVTGFLDSWIRQCVSRLRSL